MPHTPMRIGELARTLGTTTKTLRFYEKIGLIDEPGRSSAGYRLYDARMIDHARLVFGVRRLGLSIEEVRELLHSDDGTNLRQRLMAAMEERLRNIDLELGVLQGRREDFAARLDALLATPRDRPGQCICEAVPMRCTCGLYP